MRRPEIIVYLPISYIFLIAASMVGPAFARSRRNQYESQRFGHPSKLPSRRNHYASGQRALTDSILPETLGEFMIWSTFVVVQTTK
jgi:hypothetical protein